MREGAYADIRQLERDHWWYRGTRAVYRSLLRRYAPRAAGPVLDVGCGSGGNLALLSDWGPVTGLDPWHPALRACPAGQARLSQGDARALPFADGTFGLVAVLGVLEHVADDVGVLREARRVCHPGGVVLLLTSAFMFLWSQHDEANRHLIRYTAGELRARAASAGLQVRYLSYQNAFLFPLVVPVRLLQRLLPASGEPRIDMFPVPEPLNSALAGLLALEGRLMARVGMRFPAGVSLVAVLER
jgi:SAM-dependent methyltransferase